MTKADIKRSLREFAGGDWISKRGIKRWLKAGDPVVSEIIEGLGYRVQGKAMLFFVPDVADRVMFQTVRGWN